MPNERQPLDKTKMFDRTRFEINYELEAARKEFPMPNTTFKALVEEVGEVGKALMNVRPGDRDSNIDVYRECIQVATMAIRILEEGDVDTPAYTPHLGMSG